jgi:serine/threonine protein kinase
MDPSPNLVAFYGSFKVDDYGYLVLEFAEAGTLQDFFDNALPPTTATEVAQFWTSLLQSINGLNRIHQIMRLGNNELILG